MSARVGRIVSLVPSTTESVVVFGAADRLVGCTRYCVEPAAMLSAVPRIGGTKNPDAEAIMGLRPDLVLANAEENRAEDVAWLSERVSVLVQTPRTVGEAVVDLRALAVRLDALDAAQPVLQRIEAQIAAARTAPVTPRRRVYYAIWRKPWMTVSGDTFIGDVLRLVGGDNVAAEEPARYPELSPEAATERGVDLVLLASEPWQFDVAQRDEIAQARLFGSARIGLCDGRDFCWHGARMTEGLGRALALLGGTSRHVC